LFNRGQRVRVPRRAPAGPFIVRPRAASRETLTGPLQWTIIPHAFLSVRNADRTTITELLPPSLAPPDRFARATFASYQASTASQRDALTAARAFTNQLKARPSLSERVRRFFTSSTDPTEQGLYFVGPVGTGKTHLIAAMYHALHPEVSCAFLHASTLFRSTVRPAHYAAALAERCDVLCLDEVEIDDPANEARLVLVLRALEEHGVKLLTTSNVKPEQFMANRMGSGRFERFLQKQFTERYRLVFVGGDDYRLRATNGRDAKGKGWIGPRDSAHRALQDSYRRCTGDRLWLSFDAFRDASRSTAHDQLLAHLTSYDHLFIADVQVQDTDDALRLLRVVDELYVRPDAPQLYLSFETPPAQWFHATDQGEGIAGDVAKKFARTTSRLHALCDIKTVAPSNVPQSDAND